MAQFTFRRIDANGRCERPNKRTSTITLLCHRAASVCIISQDRGGGERQKRDNMGRGERSLITTLTSPSSSTGRIWMNGEVRYRRTGPEQIGRLHLRITALIGRIGIAFAAPGPFDYAAPAMLERRIKTKITTATTTSSTKMTSRGESSSSPGWYPL